MRLLTILLSAATVAGCAATGLDEGDLATGTPDLGVSAPDLAVGAPDLAAQPSDLATPLFDLALPPDLRPPPDMARQIACAPAGGTLRAQYVWNAVLVP